VIILGIETSCDETAAAVVRDGRQVLSNVVASQTELHGRYGGIVPELASRRHVTAITLVLQAALDDAAVSRDEIDSIAVTEGPGLAGALLVGVNVAKVVAYVWGKPLIGVNHLEGHLYSNWLLPPGEQTGPEPSFPAVCLIVSGGHTELLLVHRHGVYELLGQTLDDAAGEAFDKGARILGLGYPGGPAIQRAAEGARPLEDLPRAWLPDSWDFSFSGVKTALLRACEPYRKPALPRRSQSRPAATSDDPFQEHQPVQYAANMPVGALAAAYQESIVDVLAGKTVKAAHEHGARSLLLAGGVAANRLLRERLTKNAGVPLFIPAIEYCTDNAAMIAAAAFYTGRPREDALRLDAQARFPLVEPVGTPSRARTHR
jgi:N6-L-threonylcarbamoyladenine synthase